MPPVSRGFISSSFQNGLRLYNLRPHQAQRRLIASLPPKPKLPPESVIKTSVAQSIKNNAPLEIPLKKPKTRWQSFLLRIPLPPTARRFFQAPSPPPWVRRWVWLFFILGPPLAVLSTSFPFTICRVLGPSMAPFFNVNSSPDQPAPSPDRIFVRKVHGLRIFSRFFSPRTATKLERGQIVVFYAPHDPTKLSVKRVVGLPGDRVRPLVGYPGGDENPVIIPYNHIWVEGDANSRDKSIDSNHFGPISQNMVFGHVLAAYTPWWNWPVWLKWGEDNEYPAKKSGRIEKDVVGSARLDPNEQAKQTEDPFRSGAAALELAMIKQNRAYMPIKMRARGMLDKYREMHALAERELEKGDAATRDVAGGLIDELEVAFESVGLNKDGSRVAPVVRKYEKDVEKERRLQEYLARQEHNGTAEHV